MKIGNRTFQESIPYAPFLHLALHQILTLHIPIKLFINTLECVTKHSIFFLTNKEYLDEIFQFFLGDYHVSLLHMRMNTLFVRMFGRKNDALWTEGFKYEGVKPLTRPFYVESALEAPLQKDSWDLTLSGQPKIIDSLPASARLIKRFRTWIKKPLKRDLKDEYQAFCNEINHIKSIILSDDYFISSEYAQKFKDYHIEIGGGASDKDILEVLIQKIYLIASATHAQMAHFIQCTWNIRQIHLNRAILSRGCAERGFYFAGRNHFLTDNKIEKHLAHILNETGFLLIFIDKDQIEKNTVQDDIRLAKEIDPSLEGLITSFFKEQFHLFKEEFSPYLP